MLRRDSKRRSFCWGVSMKRRMWRERSSGTGSPLLKEIETRRTMWGSSYVTPRNMGPPYFIETVSSSSLSNLSVVAPGLSSSSPQEQTRPLSGCPAFRDERVVHGRL